MTEGPDAEPESPQDWSIVSRFRRMVLGLSVLLIAVLAGFALLAGTAAARGVVMGGLASMLGFEITVRTFREAHRNLAEQKVANAPGNRVKFRPSIWWVVRFLAYIAVLVKSYSLDTAQYRGLFGAVVGLLIVRVVVMGVGITGVDLKKASS